MLGIALIAWLAALGFAVVVLAFCGYEVVWKARRLQRDLATLQTVTTRLQGVQAELAAAQRRLARAAAG